MIIYVMYGISECITKDNAMKIVIQALNRLQN